jgi:hypothetical protein
MSEISSAFSFPTTSFISKLQFGAILHRLGKIPNIKVYVPLDSCTEHFSNLVQYNQQMLKDIVSAFFLYSLTLSLLMSYMELLVKSEI